MRNRIIVLVSLFLLLVCSAGAQRRGENRAEQMLQELTGRLELAPQQQDTIRQILEESAESMRDARETAGGNREDMAQMMRSIQKKTDARIESVLSAKQKPAFEKFKKEREERRERRPEGRMRPDNRDARPGR